ncbi:uncharacterized protein LOC116133174 isoform X2 [Pistacia vera]|uniref:uncharacterized protein LOC116133174 isoform X2 n=1 Tax=Pistacia vera TaxID=55513 RepID=UPI00126346BB|nr:uncharacterized protein LOC116133174 isoform X2 [Pistacia vera]XP_031274704.1 uncharacterized protein LOC116133174 isoform X2 [Pistacia vera]
MSDTNGKINKSIRQTESSSRLSPLAKPFNFNNQAHEYDGQQSFNSFSLDLCNLKQLYDYGGCYDQSDPFLIHSDSDAMSSSFAKAAHQTVIGDHTSSLSSNSFPKQDECTHPQPSEYKSPQARVMRPSGTVDSCGDAAVMIEPHILLNANDKIVCHENVPIGKGKEKKNGEHANNEAIDSLVMATRKLSITSLDCPDVFSLETDGTKSGVPVQNSSVVLDQNDSDSDVDSPCWIGTGAYQSPFEVTKPVGSQLPRIEIEARKTLNPLAPHFFPESAKQLANFHESDSNGNDHLSFMMDLCAGFSFSTKEQRFIDSVKAGAYSSEMSNVIGTQCSNNIHDGGKIYSLPKKSNNLSVPNSLLGDQPFLLEDYLTSSGQGVIGADVTGPMKNIKDTVCNGSSCVTSAVTGNFRILSCSRDGVPSVVDGKLQGASKSTSPKLDVQSVISTMHDLSKLLLWNYSNDLDSINEHEHDMIQQIINNLNICMTNKVGQRISIPESGHHCTLHSPMKLSDCNKEFKLTRLKTMTVPHDWERQKSWSTRFDKKVAGPSSYPINGEGIKNGDAYTEVESEAALRI